MYEMFKPEKVKTSVNQDTKKDAKEIMDWAVRKQKAHDQAVMANMFFGMDNSKSKK